MIFTRKKRELLNLRQNQKEIHRVIKKKKQDVLTTHKTMLEKITVEITLFFHVKITPNTTL